MDTRIVKLTLVLLLVVCLGSAASLWAQSTSTGTVAGGITDQSGAVVPGATVTLTDNSTNIARTTTTNKDGRYIFVDVNPGIYRVAINKTGFATTKTENQEVKVGAALTLNLSLQVGGTNVVVEVQATGTELQTMNATVGNDLTSIAIDNLPSLGRDVSTFVTLQPGVGTDGSVAGAFMDQSYFSLDGGYNSNDMDGSNSIYTTSFAGDPTGGVGSQFFGTGTGPTGVMPTPQDSVEEFKVNTAGQTADFNSSAGAEVKVITKRGTNAWHGTGYEYYKDNNWSSNSWQNNYTDGGMFPHTGLPSFHYSRFGGAIGGPLIPKDVLGGKTYVFFNYEGFRWPDSETINRNVPSPALRLGLITDSTTGAIDYNLNNAQVTYNGTTYAANYGCTGPCDPLTLGLNPLVSQIWNTYEPQANHTCVNSFCDSANILGYSANLAIPQTSKFAVARLDHDFGAKWHFMTSYRYYNLKAATDSQVDIGGFFTGDKLGTPASLSGNPQQDWFWVAGLTTNISPNTTNDIHYSFLRNWWAYARAADTPQVAGLGGALEIMAGQANGQVQDLGPFNVNNQQTRTRFWDGHDQMLRDDVSMLKGNHLFQFGGTYQHNFDWHQRNDSGGFINEQPVYSLGNGTNGSGLSSDVFPCGGTNNVGAATSVNNCGALTAAALGIISVSSQAYSRSGINLTLNPALTPAFDQSTIPYYNVYFSDTWHMKPTFTLTYGLGWTLEMPPTEANGKQIVAVDQSDEPISTQAYLDERKRAALAGQVFNPEIGFALTGNTANGLKYPYNPFYGGFSPRIAAAWSPHFDHDSPAGRIFGHEDTVIRGGYGRVYGRLNGVTQVLLPLLGLGLIQPVSCNQNLFTPGPPGAFGGNGSCGATGSATPSNAFRVGLTPSAVGGPIAPIPVLTPTLPQPDFPGFNNTGAASPSVLDSNFRPNAVDSFNLTIQRQLSRKITLELGYIGRRITHDFEPINLNAVPYMMTLGGQTFANAYKNVVLQYCGGIAGLAGGGCGGSALLTPGVGPNPAAVTPQPFFETALGGPSSAYCTGFTSCTAAVVSKEGATGTYNLVDAGVWGLWSDLDNGGFTFPRSMMNTPIPANCGAGTNNFGCGGQMSSGVASDASIGYGNYNAGFASLKMADFRGFTLQSNFTWSKALGSAGIYQAVSAFTVDDPFNLGEGYGRQGFDRKYTFNTFVIYQPPFFKGQSGMMGRVLGGWTFASVFTAGSGTPIEVGSTFFLEQEFGSADGIGFGNDNTAVPIGPQSNESAHYNSPSSSLPINAFKNGTADYQNWRNPILGLDNKDCGAGCISGLPYWNMDFSVKKNIRVAESVSMEFQGVFTNILNHSQFLDANFNYLGSPSNFGALPGQPGAGPRNIELGVRFRF